MEKGRVPPQESTDKLQKQTHTRTLQPQKYLQPQPRLFLPVARPLPYPNSEWNSEGAHVCRSCPCFFHYRYDRKKLKTTSLHEAPTNGRTTSN